METYNMPLIDMVPPIPTTYSVDMSARNVKFFSDLASISVIPNKPSDFSDVLRCQLGRCDLAPLGSFVFVFSLFGTHVHMLTSGYILEIAQSIILLLAISVMYLLIITRFPYKSFHNQRVNKECFGFAGNRKSNAVVSIFSVVWFQVLAKNCAFSGFDPPYVAKVTDNVKTFVPWNRFPNFFHNALSPTKNALFDCAESATKQLPKRACIYFISLFGRKSIIPQRVIANGL